MDAPKPAPDLSQLRRELQEILSMVSGGVSAEHAPKRHEASPEPQSEAELSASTAAGSESVEVADDLFDDALVVITEFGQATPAILQMWLSIDYNSAIDLLGQFEARELVSPRGKVRHKAYDLRRDRCLEFKL